LGEFVKLSSRAIAAQLNLREWIALCALIDGLNPQRTVDGLLLQKKFNVLSICRQSDSSIEVLVDFGRGQFQRYRINPSPCPGAQEGCGAVPDADALMGSETAPHSSEVS
jgi:hypothetical protein